MSNVEPSKSSIFLRRFLENPEDGPLSKQFFDRFQPQILKSIEKLGLQEADAEDMASALLMKFFEKGYFQKFVFEGRLKFYSWLHVSVRHAIFEFVRRQKRTPNGWSLDNPAVRDQIEPMIDQWGNAVREIYERDLEIGQRAYTNIKAQFEEKSIRAFHMQVIEGRSGSEVARILGMSVAAVYQAKGRVAKALAQEFKRLREMESG